MVSVIVPIYNVEKYLKKCVKSIINQTYSNIEIILVNDGSTDGCGDICDELAKQDDRIKVIHKENGGLSDARNCGIEASIGDWLVFIDGDDFIHPRMIERLQQLVKQYDCDMGACGFQPVYENADIQDDAPSQDYPIHFYETDEIYKQFGRLEITLAWNKIYKRSLFDNIRYPKGHLHEDEFIIHHLAGECKRFVFTEEKLYYYLTRDGSIMSKVSKQRIEDIVYALKDRIVYYGNKGLDELRRSSCDDLINSLIMCGYHSKDYAPSQKKELLQCINTQILECKRLFAEEISMNYEKQIKFFLQKPEKCYSYRKRWDYKNRIKDKLKRMLGMKRDSN
ncbi:MAG: glycosyltransferase [Lachnospiraceae bacterium]|nr:glycosyltransferase [Lachnospiraceae bacterium]